jgi:hypothetical protein
MAAARLRRNSFFVDPRALRRAQRALKVRTQAEVVRVAIERVLETDRFWAFMKRSRRTLSPKAFGGI